MQSFLNIIDLETGRQIRAAELGYYAERPSFCEGGSIRFYRDGKPMLMSLESGAIQPDGGSRLITAPDSPNVRLGFLSEPVERVAYVELIFDNGESSRVLARFMGGEGSLGENPISPDRKKLVFFGYPSENGIN